MEYLNHLTALTDWFETGHGRQLYQYEAARLEQFLPNCFGYQLLQIGGPTNLQWLASSPIKHQIFLSPDPHVKASNTFCAYPDSLPFAPNSIDVVVLPHILECVTKPELIINEVCNVVNPGGFVVIMGLNRSSLWGMQQSLRILRTKNPYFPWFQHFVPLYRLQQMLFENNFAIDSVNIGCYQPLSINAAELIKPHSFWDAFGALAWSAFGAIYVILARKQIHGMTPIWDKQQKSALYEVKVGLAQQRNMNHDKAN